jgi:hypothetical protein
LRVKAPQHRVIPALDRKEHRDADSQKDSICREEGELLCREHPVKYAAPSISASERRYDCSVARKALFEAHEPARARRQNAAQNTITAQSTAEERRPLEIALVGLMDGLLEVSEVPAGNRVRWRRQRRARHNESVVRWRCRPTSILH